MSDDARKSESSRNRSAEAHKVEELVLIADRIVRESGNPEGLDAALWVDTWLATPHPALGGLSPSQLLDTVDGFDAVRRLLEQQQSGAYA